MAVEVTVPYLGEGVAEAQFAAWLVGEGDVVDVDEEIAEVMTDKANVAIVSPASGRLSSLTAAVDDTVAVGQVIATVTEVSEK